MADNWLLDDENEMGTGFGDENQGEAQVSTTTDFLFDSPGSDRFGLGLGNSRDKNTAPLLFRDLDHSMEGPMDDKEAFLALSDSDSESEEEDHQDAASPESVPDPAVVAVAADHVVEPAEPEPVSTVEDNPRKKPAQPLARKQLQARPQAQAVSRKPSGLAPLQSQLGQGRGHAHAQNPNPRRMVMIKSKAAREREAAVAAGAEAQVKPRPKPKRTSKPKPNPITTSKLVVRPFTEKPKVKAKAGSPMSRPYPGTPGAAPPIQSFVPIVNSPAHQQHAQRKPVDEHKQRWSPGRRRDWTADEAAHCCKKRTLDPRSFEQL